MRGLETTTEGGGGAVQSTVLVLRGKRGAEKRREAAVGERDVGRRDDFKMNDGGLAPAWGGSQFARVSSRVFSNLRRGNCNSCSFGH